MFFSGNKLERIPIEKLNSIAWLLRSLPFELWNRFPVESVLRALGPVLGITSDFLIVWTHLGSKLLEFVKEGPIPDVLVNILMRFR